MHCADCEVRQARYMYTDTNSMIKWILAEDVVVDVAHSNHFPVVKNVVK